MAKLSKGEINDYKINNMLRLVLYLVFIVSGGVLYTKSYLKVSTITNFLGVLFILSGVMIVYISSKEKKLKLSNYDVYFGISQALCGLLLAVNFGHLTNYLNFYLGVFFIICALQKLVVAIKLFQINEDSKLLTLVTSIIILGQGILMIINPFGNMTLTQLSGVFVLFYGILQFSNTVLLNGKEKEIIKNK